jgi:hypothetical protein
MHLDTEDWKKMKGSLRLAQPTSCENKRKSTEHTVDLNSMEKALNASAAPMGGLAT